MGGSVLGRVTPGRGSSVPFPSPRVYSPQAAPTLFFQPASRLSRFVSPAPAPRRAPEQVGPRHLHTIKVDVWGFACTFLHMVTGSPPWAGDSVLQICTAVGVGRQAPPLRNGHGP